MADGRRKRNKALDRGEAGNPANAAMERTGTIHAFFGLLAGKTKKVATIEEINEAAADGWAGLVSMDGSTRDRKRRSP